MYYDFKKAAQILQTINYSQNLNQVRCYYGEKSLILVQARQEKFILKCWLGQVHKGVEF